MRAIRLFFFVIMIIAGVLIGLAAGWGLHPISYRDTSPQTLRSDFKTDIVLMTAETYLAGGSLADASARLTRLGDQPPLRIVQEAILAAQSLGYSKQDLETLGGLFQALQSTQPNGATP